MSLIRQIRLLLLATLLLAFGASLGVGIGSARSTLQTQLRLKNGDAAAALALLLTQQQGDMARMELLMAAQFDTGSYRRIRYTDADGRVRFERDNPQPARNAPGWFVAALPIDAPAGVAQVADGWRSLGRVEVASQSAYAHDELWRGSVRAAVALGATGAVAALLAGWLLRRIRRPLAHAVLQAQALERGDYLIVDEPALPELRGLTRAMNSMVGRLKRVFEAQAAQVEALHRQAHCDALTGLSNRAHFMGRLAATLQREDGPAAGGLVLLRVLQLGELNRSLGHAVTDRLLGAIAQALLTYQQRVDGCFIGRLNGADFALCLPAGGVAMETAQALAEALRALLPAFGPKAAVAGGAVEVRHGATLAQIMGEADLALARAEGGAPFAVEAAGSAAPALAALATLGAGVWRQRLLDALEHGRLRLGAFPLTNGSRLIHRECPLRIQLEEGGACEVAAHWLPLALRSRLTARIDERVMALALAAIAEDGVPRCINLATASLLDSAFAPRLHALAAEAPRAARLLWVEFGEGAAVEQFDLMRELGRQLRPLGVRYGLEHAGERLLGVERLFEAGLDYVKLDAAVTQGVADDAARAGFVKGLATMLHSLSLQVYAEGVSSPADAQALLGCGMDGLTGPWISAQQLTPQS